MGSSDDFSLRWDDYETNVSTSLCELRNEPSFFDVTLIASNGPEKKRQIHAHRLILAACSPFFKSVLCDLSANSNPCIYLHGISSGDISHVLDFMYNGKVNVELKDLNDFLAVAEELQVKGLMNSQVTNVATEKDFLLSKENDLKPNINDYCLPPKRLCRGRTSSDNLLNRECFNAEQSSVINRCSDDDVYDTINDSESLKNIPKRSCFKFEDGEIESSGVVEPPITIGSMDIDDSSLFSIPDGFEDSRRFDAYTIQTHDGTWLCRLCNKQLSAKFIARRHVKDVHMSTHTVTCQICRHVFKNKGSFRAHQRLKHKTMYQAEKVLSTGGEDDINKNVEPSSTDAVVTNDVQLDSLTFETKDGNWMCTVCNKQLSAKSIARRHVKEVHMSGERIECYICQHLFKNKGSFLSHLRHQHKQNSQDVAALLTAK